MSISISLTDLKRIQLEIMQSVHEFCEQNGVEYYLTYGTLIGAIRHNGYIPWDDDIDICMTRPNYERFMHLFNKKQNRYKFISYELDKDFLYTFGKVMDNDTVFIEETHIQYPLGVNIDIFPIDGVDVKGKVLKKQILLRSIANLKTIKYSQERSLYKNILLVLGKTILIPIQIETIIKKMIKNAKLNSFEESKEVSCAVMGTKLNLPVPKEYFLHRVLVSFEDYEFYVPKEYDLYLRSVFGNYMELPPEDKRQSHHVFEAYYKEDK